MIKYHYTDTDLSRLTDELRTLGQNVSEAYVLFNNVSMFEDAKRFLEIVREKGFEV